MPSSCPRTILVAVDGSSYSERAFNYRAAEFEINDTQAAQANDNSTGTFRVRYLTAEKPSEVRPLLFTLMRDTQNGVTSTKLPLGGEGYAEKFRKDGDQVVFVHVYESPITPPPTFANCMSIPPREEWERMLQKAERQAVELLSEYEKKCKDIELPFKTVYAYGPIGHVICTAARDQNAECIILGSRGLGTIRRTILGSVCDYVTQHMNVPVLMVPPADKC